MRKQFFVMGEHFSPARQGMYSRHDDRAVRCIYGTGFVRSTPSANIYRAKLDRKINAEPQTTPIPVPLVLSSLIHWPLSCEPQYATRSFPMCALRSTSLSLSLSKFLLFAGLTSQTAENPAVFFRVALSTPFPYLFDCGIIACESSDRIRSS